MQLRLTVGPPDGQAPAVPGAGVGALDVSLYRTVIQVAAVRPAAVAVTPTSGTRVRTSSSGTPLAACSNCDPSVIRPYMVTLTCRSAAEPACDPAARASENQGAAGVTHCVWETSDNSGPAAVGETVAPAAGTTPGSKPGSKPARKVADRASVQRATLIRRIDTGRGYRRQAARHGA